MAALYPYWGKYQYFDVIWLLFIATAYQLKEKYAGLI